MDLTNKGCPCLPEGAISQTPHAPPTCTQTIASPPACTVCHGDTKNRCPLVSSGLGDFYPWHGALYFCIVSPDQE